MSIFDQIRESCRKVTEASRHVKINIDRISAYLASLPLHELEHLEMDTENHFCGDEEATVNYFVVLDCINFGSGYFKYLIEDPGKTGYFTISSRLKHEFSRRGKFECSFLKQITPDECAGIFGQNPADSEVYELMNLFSEALQELGNFVAANFSGSFVKLVQAAENRADKLVELLMAMKFYQDKAIYQNHEVFFLKRAQITVSDLNIALGGQGLGFFSDLDQLTIFADNLVPHVLWCDGMLNYSQELTEKITSQSLIEAGSDFEVELRAAAVHAVELLKQQANQTGNNFTAQQLDYLLWNRGQADIYRTPHRTLSYFY